MKGLLCGTAAVTLVGTTLIAAPGWSDPVADGVFAVSDVGTNNQITVGPDGAIWLTLQGAKDVARIGLDGVVTEYDDPGVTAPIGITAGPDGNLWVTYTGGVARFAPASPTTMVKTALADIVDPRAITVGPDGNLWTASADKVLAIPVANPAGATTFASTGVMGARWITSGSQQNVWVADFGGQRIVRVTTAGVGASFPTGGGPQGIAGGPNGQVLFSDPGTNPQTIGRLTASVETTPTPMADPFGVTFGTDGAYWVAQFAANSLGRLTPNGEYSTLALPAGSGPRQITAGPANTLWVTLDNTEQVARVSGVVAPTPTPAPVNPTTKITKKPAKVVRKKSVRFRFTGTTGSTFQCRMDAKWRTCAPGIKYRVARGKHVFRVRAVLGDEVDPTPAKWRFRRR